MVSAGSTSTQLDLHRIIGGRGRQDASENMSIGFADVIPLNIVAGIAWAVSWDIRSIDVLMAMSSFKYMTSRSMLRLLGNLFEAVNFASGWVAAPPT